MAQQIVCPGPLIQQITDDPVQSSVLPSMSGDGNRISFGSFANINGENPENNLEIYLFDVPTGEFTAVSSNPVGNTGAQEISEDGNRIAFGSTADINGGNPDGNEEIYLQDIASGTTKQITFTSILDGHNEEAFISGDGERVAFQTNITSANNPEGNYEIYLFDNPTDTLIMITDEPAGVAARFPSLNGDGTLVAFSSNSTNGGLNPEGNRELFLANTNTNTITQITSTTSGDAFQSTISSDGSIIAFAHTGNVAGLNTTGNRQIFLYNTVSGLFTAVTTSTDGDSFVPNMNGDATCLAFHSNADITGGNPLGGQQVYLYNLDLDLFVQVTTDLDGQAVSGAVDNSCTLVSFTSNANINEGNPDNNFEVYLAQCVDPAELKNVPTLSEWGLIAMASILGVAGFMVLRRRKLFA
jgi:Tol biopolymer transport system component